MTRPRKYKSNAERQRAYRQRLKAAQAKPAAVAVPVLPGENPIKVVLPLPEAPPKPERETRVHSTRSPAPVRTTRPRPQATTPRPRRVLVRKYPDRKVRGPNRTPYRRWTDEEDAMLLNGVPIRDMVAVTGRTVDAASLRRRMLRKRAA